MDPNKSTVPLSVSDSRPVAPSPVTDVTAPTTVEEGLNHANKKRKYDIRDEKGKFISKSGTQIKRSLRNSRGGVSLSLGGDMLMPLGGGDFTPHIFTVEKGEDVIQGIMSFTENGARGISVLSVTGLVCNVRIQPLGLSRNYLTYKDTYELVSLKSTMAITESAGVINKTGGWRITIGGASCGVFGGALVGKLTAASQVQVVVGSFWPLITNPSQKRNNESEAVVVPPTNPTAPASIPVQQSDMIVPNDHSQKGKDKSKAVYIPTKPTALASSSTRKVQQYSDLMMVLYDHSQKENDKSEAVIVPPTIPNTLASSSTGRQVQHQQPDMIGPSDHSQKRNDESQAVVVPPTIPSALASSSTEEVQEPEMRYRCPSPILTLGWYNMEPDHNK